MGWGEPQGTTTPMTTTPDIAGRDLAAGGVNDDQALETPAADVPTYTHSAVLTPAPEGDPDQRPRRKIAIVGYTASRDEAPYDDPTWEVWGMNNLHAFIPPEKFDRWYNLHPGEEIQKDAQHCQWLAAWHRCDVYLMDPADALPAEQRAALPPMAERVGVPRAVRFPAAEIRERLGTDYFTNTVSWQVAHAIYEGVVSGDDYVLTDLALFGVDMAVNTEYAAQRPSVEFYLGLARGLGIDIFLPDTSDLLKSIGLYGVSDASGGFLAKMRRRREELMQQKSALEQQQHQIDATLHQCIGALDTVNYVVGAWGSPAVANEDRDAVVAQGAFGQVGQALAVADAAERHQPSDGQGVMAKALTQRAAGG